MKICKYIQQFGVNLGVGPGLGFSAEVRPTICSETWPNVRPKTISLTLFLPPRKSRIDPGMKS